jgi:hypothetical protein
MLLILLLSAAPFGASSASARAAVRAARLAALPDWARERVTAPLRANAAAGAAAAASAPRAAPPPLRANAAAGAAAAASAPRAAPPPPINAGLRGSLLYGALAYSAVQLLAFDVATGGSAPLLTAPAAGVDWEWRIPSAFVGAGALALAPMTDTPAVPGRTGLILDVNVTARVPVSSFPTNTDALAVWPDPDAPTEALLCLSEDSGARCPAGTVNWCIALLRINRTSGAVAQVGQGLLPDVLPAVEVTALDVERGLIYLYYLGAAQGKLAFLIASIDARTGALVRTAVAEPFTTAWGEIFPTPNATYSLLEDKSNPNATVPFLATVDPATAAVTPVGAPFSAPLNFTYFGESALSSELGVLFSVGYLGPATAPTAAFLLGLSLNTGALVYQQQLPLAPQRSPYAFSAVQLQWLGGGV